jgi:SPP1 gp7 family putative phage head morphogenesis protein
MKNDEEIFTDEEINDYILAVFVGSITVDTLSKWYHRKLTDHFKNDIIKGWGKIDPDNKKEAKILDEIEKNIYQFSAAKQYQQVRGMEDVIKKMSKKAASEMSFHEFKKEVLEIFEDYNIHWLKTERNTVITQSQNAKKWVEIQSEIKIFPYLQYKSQHDNRVRHEHALLHNKIYRADNPIWGTIYPPNGWNCRCYVQQLETGKENKISDIPKLSKKKFPELFRMNAGTDKYVFNKKGHPYFKIKKGDGKLKKNNFNLPTE